MIIEAKAGPTLANPNSTDSASQLAAKARAIATLQQLQSGTAVNNATQVTPEELSAVKQAPRQQDVIDSSNSEQLPEAETKAAAKEEPLSSQYAVLARKEKQLRLRDQQLRQREAAIKASESPAKPAFDESKYVPKDRLSQDPFAVLNELGLDYEKLTNLVLNGPTPDQRTQTEYVKKLEARLEALEGTQQKTLKTFEERDNQSRTIAVSQITHEVNKLLKSDPTYEAITATNSTKDVVELIARTFDEDGHLLTVEEAAQQVEDYLVDEAMKIAKLKKIQHRLQQQSPQSNSSPVNGQPKQQQMKTLTNSVSSSRKLTSKERAILAFKGELKS